MVVSPSQVTYVFLAVPYGTDPKLLNAELELRCFLARGMNRRSSIVVGIGTEYFENEKSSALFFYYLEKSDWSADDETHANKMKEELGYFLNPKMKSMHEDEYPNK